MVALILVEEIMASLVTSTVMQRLLSGMVDYAGGFPPAKLELHTAMATYARHHALNQAMLGRFVLPAARLREFTELVSHFTVQSWSLSVVLSTQTEVEIEQIYALQNPAIAIKALEFPVFPADQIDRLCRLVPVGTESFFEIPLHQPLEVYLSALHRAKVFAKIRTGGITPDAIPSIHQLTHFLLACAQYPLPFKATAGLHHLLRGKYRLTYNANSAIAPMHGFLNLAIATVLVYWQKIGQDELAELLGDSVITSFQIQDDHLLWRSQHQQYSLSLAEIQTARQHFFRSFGSCSVQEPLDELAAFLLT